MARPPLTLAALATAAVPGLEVRAVRAHTRRSHGAYDAVLLRSTDDRMLVLRVPRSQAAESEQSADLVALRALTPGIRSRLPFALPEVVGQAPIDGTRAVVTTFVPGAARSADELTEHDGIATSVGLALAAVHALPTGFIADAGLPRQTADESHDAVVELIDRAADTGHLPAALLRRWEEATDDAALWRFRPTVVNGALAADSLLVDGDTVTGLIGWSALAQGDPARDLHWLLTSRGAAAERALDAYFGARAGEADSHLPQRALLYGELELAKWLLHGVEVRDDAIIADAVGLLDGLVESVHDRSSEPLSPETGPILTVGDVERMLDETPRDGLSREAGGSLLTDSYDFSDLERREAGERDAAPFDATAPIPLDLSDWGDASPSVEEPAEPADPAGPADPADDRRAGQRGDGTGSDAATDAQARRNAASS
ncbi:phosphotransferase [Agromyces sp. Root1464]|uniref:phosphotransferase n=1 Tax=Agromyces sp. Root1464 TaxID=1736467 RepID=UPI001910DAF5|nr:phosphotransferase [Agromyces sp. Root1464]